MNEISQIRMRMEITNKISRKILRQRLGWGLR